jgi:hypothetical protein
LVLTVQRLLNRCCAAWRVTPSTHLGVDFVPEHLEPGEGFDVPVGHAAAGGPDHAAHEAEPLGHLDDLALLDRLAGDGLVHGLDAGSDVGGHVNNIHATTDIFHIS